MSSTSVVLRNEHDCLHKLTRSQAGLDEVPLVAADLSGFGNRPKGVWFLMSSLRHGLPPASPACLHLSTHQPIVLFAKLWVRDRLMLASKMLVNKRRTDAAN